MLTRYLVAGFLAGLSWCFDSHLRGPTFVMEPPSRLEFSNSSGGWLDCSASGSPQPAIEWLSADGTSVGDVAGVRRVLRNGTLHLQPFAASSYRQDIHSAVYRCVASNAVGRILSRDVQVKAVVTQSYKADVEVIAAPRGCTALLRCIVPSFVKDFVRVVSWIQEPSFYIYPSLQGDGKFHQLPTGELLIHNLEFSDQFSTYRCKTMHRLSRQVVTSNPSNVRISEHRGIIKPVILQHSGTVSVAQDEGAALVCVAQGCPAPEFRWYHHTDIEPSLVISGPRLRQLGPVLAIEAVTSEDGGLYTCSVSNAGGEARADFRLSVATALHVEISPAATSVHMGGSAEFRCAFELQGDVPHLVTWYKNGRQLPSTGRGSSETLVINNVGREDRGMYQCLVRRPEGESAQAAAELQLGDAPPVMLYTFIEQTLQPGPAVSLKCSASGNPTPQISWTLDGFPLPSHGRFVIGQYVTVHGDVISHVNISHVMVEDGGEYTCTAENRAGKTSHSAQLNIYGMPYIRLIPKVTAIAGETLKLKCPVAGYPIEEIHWERGGRELPDGIRQKVLPDGTLIIQPVEKRSDSGVYTCWARNKQGHSARRSGEVNVIVPPKVSPFYSEEILHLGDRASLTCSVTKGDLPLTIQWHKDGRRLDAGQLISITQVDQFTSILVIESLSQEHNGNYSCMVRNLAAEVSHTQRLVVNVPPIIEPFSFQDGLSEGMRTRTVCGVSSGDPPLAVSWLKDGQPLMPQLGVNVSALDSYSSLLSISSLDSRHSGNFTCVALNAAAEVRYTAQLQVKVPPRWSVEPMDVSVERNRHASLHCQAQGVPTPTIIWKKAVAGKSGSYEEVRDHIHTKLLGNGTLFLQHVKETSEGYYLCQAENGVGTGIGKVIQLKVNSSPYFSAPSPSVVVKRGDTAILRCNVNGDKPISVVWLRGGTTEMNPSNNYRIQTKQDVIPDGVTAELQLINADIQDSGAYFCHANNLYGRDQQLVQLIVQEPPSRPENVKAAMVSSNSISISWEHKSKYDNEALKYTIQYSEDNKSWQQLEATDMLSTFMTVIENLKPATKYYIRVIAEGSAGKSDPSPEITVRTEPQRPAGPPLNLEARAVSSTEFLISWQPPLSELRNGDIQGYYVGYRSLSMSAFNFTTAESYGEDGGELLLGGLDKYTTYAVVVQAYNEVGTGPLAEPVSAQTLEDVPSMPPSDVRCVALTSQSLQLSWQPPPQEHCNGLLQGYKVLYENVPQNDFDDEQTETRKTSALTTVITGLRKYTNYSLQILAFTKVGDGVFTSPIYCKTDEDVPGPPADIKAITTSATSLKLSWLTPLEPNGVITRYNIYMRSMSSQQELQHDKQSVSSQYLSYEINDVHTHVEYQFWITASTRIGEGQSSKVVSEVASKRVPAKIISFGTVIVKAWKSPLSLACDSVGWSKREWYRGDKPMKSFTGSYQYHQDSGTLMFSTLQPSDSNNYTCQVESEMGVDRITYMLVVQVPPSAPLLYVTSATSNSLLLHWKAAKNGAAPISGFTLNYKKEHGNLEEVHLSKHINIYELKHLSCGTMYHLYLTAHNKIGSSPASHPLQAHTQGQPPGVPPAAAFIATNSTFIALRLHLWPDNGCPIQYFILQYRKHADKQWTLVSKNVKPQRRTTIQGLTPATHYFIRLEAHNVAGFATGEFSVSTLTEDGHIPAQDWINLNTDSSTFFGDLKMVLLMIILIVVGFLSAVGLVLYLRSRAKRRKRSTENLERRPDAQVERCYATIHKASLQPGEKIPETSGDISPYATFQLSEPSTLAQNTMLHTFMYTEHPMTEGCASTPPPLGAVSSAYCNIADSIYKRRRMKGKMEMDMEESESDQDQIISSRTESSSHLDMKHKYGTKCQGTQSSTSSEISPMSEQKSLPRRKRSRYLTSKEMHSQAFFTKNNPRKFLGQEKHPHKSMSGVFMDDTSFVEKDRPISEKQEISEAECDIDMLKKRKSSLSSPAWSKHTTSMQSSDYSIAV